MKKKEINVRNIKLLIVLACFMSITFSVVGTCQ